MSNRPAFTLALSLLFIAAPAAAQTAGDPPAASPAAEPPVVPPPAATCAGGRVASPESAGRCCWPGQVWSEEQARCAGPPSCPSGLIAHGDECIVADSAPAQSTPIIPSIGPAPSAPPPALSLAPASPGWGELAAPPQTRQSRDHSTIGNGVALFLGAWTASVSGGAFYLASNPSMCGSTAGPLLFVPLVGPLGSAIALETCGGDKYYYYRNTTWDWIFGATLSALQTAGFVFALVGTFTQREIVVARDGEGAPIVQLELAPYPTLRF